MKWPWQRRETLSDEALEIEKSLQQTRLLIAQAYAGFNSAADQELVESYVYEIQALQARYSYLLRQRKSCGVSGGEKTVPRTASGGRLPAGPLPSQSLSQKAVAPEQPRAEEGPVAPVLPVA